MYDSRFPIMIYAVMDVKPLKRLYVMVKDIILLGSCKDIMTAYITAFEFQSFSRTKLHKEVSKYILRLR